MPGPMSASGQQGPRKQRGASPKLQETTILRGQPTTEEQRIKCALVVHRMGYSDILPMLGLTPRGHIASESDNG